jgi:hypothetical protein
MISPEIGPTALRWTNSSKPAAGSGNNQIFATHAA